MRKAANPALLRVNEVLCKAGQLSLYIRKNSAFYPISFTDGAACRPNDGVV
jgi:hypothetical protein